MFGSFIRNNSHRWSLLGSKRIGANSGLRRVLEKLRFVLKNQSNFLSQLLKIFILGHQAKVTQWTEVRILYLTYSSHQSNFFGKVPRYFYSSSLATHFETFELLHHLVTLIFYLNCPILPSFWQIIIDWIFLLDELSPITLKIKLGFHPKCLKRFSKSP